MQELYVKEMPKSCLDCPCFDDCRIQCNITYNDLEYIYKSDKDKGNKDCPLKSLHDHDKELVAKVLESVKNEAYKDGFCDEDGNKIITYHINNYILDQIQKEFEK